MDAPVGSAAREEERERIARAHYEIFTALTIFGSNVELLRIGLRRTPHPEGDAFLRAHLAEIEAAASRLHDVARELKRWYDEAPSSALGEGVNVVVGEREPAPSQLRSSGWS